MRGSIVHLIVLLCVASTTEAAIKQWVGGTGTSFATPDNWVAPPDTEDPTPPPGPGDFADFTAFGGLVTFPANVTNAQTLVTQTVEFQLLTNTYSTELTVADLSQLQCDVIADKLNRRPRKRHGYKTPEQCYAIQ